MIAALVLFLIGIGNIRDGVEQLKAARKKDNEPTQEGDNLAR